MRTVTAYTALLQKLSRRGRLVAMGVGLDGATSYTMNTPRRLRITVKEHDAFSRVNKVVKPPGRSNTK